MYAIDFFCGAGGMTEGLRQAGLDVLAGVDLDGEAGRSYTANHGAASVFIEADVNRLSPAALGSLIGGRERDELVLVGCSPCQYWSKMRTRRERSLEGSRLLLRFADFVARLQPGWVVVENVPGLLSKGGAIVQAFSERLSRMGYRGLTYGIVKSADYGVPQSRRRFVLLATRLLGALSLPPACSTKQSTVWDVIGPSSSLCALEAGEVSASDPLHRAARLSPKNLKRIRLTPSDGGDRQAWRDTHLQIPAYVGRDSQFSNVYGRMWWHRVGPTLTTRFNSLSNGRFGHPEQDRAISLREGALLQTFPAGYEFIGTDRSITRQIGNAVPPALAYNLGKSILFHHDCAAAAK